MIDVMGVYIEDGEQRTHIIDMDALEQRLRSYSRELVEERAYKIIVKDLLCLAYAIAIEPIVTDLFVCVGCLESQGNQEAHACVMLTPNDRIDIHFEEALNKVNHSDAEQIWREFLMRSCVPSLTLHRLMNEEHLRSEDYVKANFARKIKRYVKKIGERRLEIYTV